MNNDKKDFPFPLDTDIEEQVPVKKVHVSVDEKGNINREVKTVMEKQTVRYIDPPKTKARCDTGAHVFKCLDTHRYLFGCTLCPFHMIVHPIYFTFDEATGKLTHRRTGKVV